jgi:two-component system alkaline phosphatase synthesis response regulator PhoP
MLIKENIIQALKRQNKQGFMLCEIISIINEVTQTTELPDIESEGILLNYNNFEVVVNGKKTTIPKKEFNLLYYLISKKNKILYRNDIIRDVWGSEIIVLDRTIDVHIRKLRKVVGKDKIKTIKCVGYGWFETK